MENCLVTKLKAEVNIANPRYFDTLYLYAYCNLNEFFTIKTSQASYVQGGDGVTVKILSNNAEVRVSDVSKGAEYTIKEEDSLVRVYKISGADSEPIQYLLEGIDKIEGLAPANSTTFITESDTLKYIAPNLKPYNGGITLLKAKLGTGIQLDGNWISLINNKSNITFIANATGTYAEPLLLDLASLSGFTAITSIPVGALIYTGDIAVLSSLTNLTALRPGNQDGVYGDLSSIQNLVNLTNLEILNTNIIGSITSLGKMTALTNLNMTNLNAVDGAIEDFVAALYTNGKKSASSSTRVRIYSNGTNITLNGIKTNVNGKYLAWDDGGSAPSNIRFENS